MIWYIWYMLGIQKWPKNLTMTEKVWLDFTNSGMCMLYKNGIWTVIQLFLLYHWCVQYQRLWGMTRNDYFWLVFNWYLTSWCTKNNLFLLWLCPVVPFTGFLGILFCRFPFLPSMILFDIMSMCHAHAPLSFSCFILVCIERLV